MRLTRSLDLLLDSLLSLVYPQPCALCNKAVDERANGIVCADCWSNTRLLTGLDSCCWKCGRPTVKPILIDQLETIRCGRCTADNYSAVRACGIYEGALKATVLALKREPHLSRRMIGMLCQQQRLFPLNRATMVVPVPLHPNRKRTRGFNQASIIAGCIAKANGVFLNEESLVRVTHSEQYRAGMDVRSRRESVRDAFAVCRPAMVEGEQILLVDDVFTTGATVSACSAVLMEAGANEVLVLTIARAD